MSFFAHALLRLKEQLGVQSDKEVAALLEMSPTAFADRKKRDAFPEDKLFAYAAKHPQQKLDVAYVLTGTPAQIHAAMADIRAAAEIAGKVGGSADQQGERIWAIHTSIQAHQTTLAAVHQAVLDAVHLLSLDKKIDAEQLAQAVVKLCAREAMPAIPPSMQSQTQHVTSHGGQVTQSGQIITLGTPAKPGGGRK